MSNSLRLSDGGSVNIDLYPWLSNKLKGAEALAGIVGFGLPGVTNQWFDGAGSGSTFRGSRVGRRIINLPLKVYAEDRAELTAQLSDLSIVLDPFKQIPVGWRGVARLYFGMADDKEWYVDVVRANGGDWSRKTDSNDRTYFKTTIGLEAGDAFWTRDEPEQFVVEKRPSENPLLPRIAKLRVGSTAVTGTRDVSNIGDTWAWPVITLKGPATGFSMIGPNGEVLEWSGVVGEEEVITLDMRNNTIMNQDGDNLYGGLAPAPRFWYIAPGDSVVSIQVDEMEEGSKLVAQWSPRRWAVV